MGTKLSISEARDRLTRLPDELAQTHEAVTITRHNQPVLAVLPWDMYEAILETLEVLSEPETTAALHQSIQDIAAGRTISLDDLKTELEAGER
jgi:prevent-host-death family protein